MRTDLKNFSEQQRATRAPARRPRARAGFFLQLAALLCLSGWGFAGVATASQLQRTTLDAFQHYVTQTENRMAREIHGPDAFLWLDQLPAQQRQAALAQLREGQVITERLETRENGQPIPIPSGLVHHWMATVFVPGVDLAQTIAQQQDFDAGADIYGPEILRSKLLQADGNDFHVYYRLHRHVLTVSAAYNADFDIQFFPLDALRAYSRSYSTRIAELVDAGLPGESEKPVGHDFGYLWRLDSYTRYLQRDGGVYIQTEFIALSRSVPAVFAWLVNPYVRSIPQEYLTHVLLATRYDLMRPRESSPPNSSTSGARLPSQSHAPGLPLLGAGPHTP